MLNKKAFLIIMVIGVVAIATIAYFYRQRPAPVTQTERPSFNSISAGISTVSQVINKFGEPINVGGEGLLEYKSKNPNINNSFIEKDGKIVFIREVITEADNITPDSLIQKYGGPEYVLYGPASVNGFNLYVSPKIGFAYLGHVKDPIVLEIWYLEPMSLDDFISKWAPEYSTTHNPIQ
jgi:hypothetical protein